MKGKAKDVEDEKEAKKITTLPHSNHFPSSSSSSSTTTSSPGPKGCPERPIAPAHTAQCRTAISPLGARRKRSSSVSPKGPCRRASGVSGLGPLLARAARRTRTRGPKKGKKRQQKKDEKMQERKRARNNKERWKPEKRKK